MGKHPTEVRPAEWQSRQIFAEFPELVVKSDI